MSKHRKVLDPVVRQIYASQSCESVERTDIGQAVIGKIEDYDVLDLLVDLGELLELLASTLDCGELEALFVGGVVQVGEETLDDAGFQNKLLSWCCCLSHNCRKLCEGLFLRKNLSLFLLINRINQTI